MMRYRASKLDCAGSSLKPQSVRIHPLEKIPRSIHEGTRDMARNIAASDAYVTSGANEKRLRCCFAPLKRI